MKICVKPSLYGTTMLDTRALGAQVRQDIESELRLGEIVVDLSDVTTMSQVFADECFGKLAESMGLDLFLQRVRVGGAAEDVELVVKLAVAEKTATRKGEAMDG